MQYKLFTGLPVLRDTLNAMEKYNNPKVSKTHIEGILKAIDKEVAKGEKIPLELFYECISIAELLHKKYNTEETQEILNLIRDKYNELGFDIYDKEPNIGNPR